MSRRTYRDPRGTTSFTVPVYGGRVLLCKNRAVYNKALKQIGVDEDDELHAYKGISQRVTDVQQHSIYMVGWFDSRPSTLVHELAHTTFAVLSHAEVPISRENEEAFAYLMDTLYADAIRALKRKR